MVHPFPETDAAAGAQSQVRPALSIVIPAYNEELRLPATVDAILPYLNAQPWTWELLVLDDGSRDNTLDVARELLGEDPRCRVLGNERNLGKGGTIRRGMLEARGRLRLFTDADNSTPINELDKLLARRKATGADVVIASRALPESRLEVRQPWHREMMGRTFNRLVQILAVPGIHDTQCGFKLFTDVAAETIFPHQRMMGFSFDVEVLMLARRAGYQIEEVPVRWINDSASRVSPVKDSLKMFRDVVTVRASRYDLRRPAALPSATEDETPLSPADGSASEPIH